METATELSARPKKKISSIVRLKNSDDPITSVVYESLQKGFAFLNDELFDGTLQNVLITLEKRSHSGGHFAPNRYARRNGDRTHTDHQVNLNPDGFVGQTDEFICSILLHEMVHGWQFQFGKAKRSKFSYHDREWSSRMEELGLMPSNTGKVGGKRTGVRMSHYIIPGGAYQKAFADLVASGWVLDIESTIIPGQAKKPPSKVKFSCLICDQNAWGKPDLEINCRICGVEMTAPVQLPVDAS